MSNDEYRSRIMGALSAQGIPHFPEDSTKDLVRLCKEHNIPLPSKDVVNAAEANGYVPSEDEGDSEENSDGGESDEGEDDSSEDGDPEVGDDPPVGDGDFGGDEKALSELSDEELKALAKERGIKGWGTSKRETLIEKLS